MKKKMDIIYEDKNLLIINKPTRLLTVGTDKQKEHTLFWMASDYVKKQYPKNKVFIVNRLDKDTSGIVVFAKNEDLKRKLQDNWDNFAKKREYTAIVEGRLPKQKDTLQSYLIEDKTFFVRSTNDSKNGKLAITNYEVKSFKNTYSLLKIEIKTGRKNQIRVQLSDIKNPIIGDKKYGSKRNPIGRLGLHANHLELMVPGYKNILTLDAKIPHEFTNMFLEKKVEHEKKING